MSKLNQTIIESNGKEYFVISVDEFLQVVHAVELHRNFKTIIPLEAITVL